MEDGGYSNWNSSSVLEIPAMGKCTSWWYNGGNLYNVPHMHVNPISYITASKNRHSRVYVTKGQHNKNTNNNLYGSVCSATVGALLGLPSGVETMAFASKLVEGFNYRDYDSFESINVGDIFSQLNLSANDWGHTIYIAEKISINGEVFCINSFEGYSPWIGWDTYINHSAHVNYTMDFQNPDPLPNYSLDKFNFLAFKTSKWFGSDGDDKMEGTVGDKPNKILARPKYTLYQTMRNAYGQYDTQDYPVTEIMCDRGTDAVYCIGEYLGLTITDDTQNIVLIKDRDLSNPTTLNLSLWPYHEYTDGKVYDICTSITESGYYEIFVNNVKKESFFIAPQRELLIYEDTVTKEDKEYRVLTYDISSETDKVIAILGEYQGKYSDGKSTLNRRTHLFEGLNEPDNIEDGMQIFYIPESTIWADGIECHLTRVNLLRKTPYGTYYIKTEINSKNPWKLKTFQRAGADTSIVTPRIISEPTCIFVNEEYNITLDANIYVPATSIHVRMESTYYPNKTFSPISGSSAHIVDNVNYDHIGDMKYITYAILPDGTQTSEDFIYVDVVYPTYYGAGMSQLDITTKASPRTQPNGTYEITVSSNSSYIFFIVPKNYPDGYTKDIKKITLNGTEIPIDTPTDIERSGIAYKCYKSFDTFDIGTYQVVITV